MNRNKIYTISITVCIIAISFIFMDRQKEHTDDNKIAFMSASWVRNYADLRDIAYHSDVIGIIHIDKKIKEEIKEGIGFTTYKATVIDPVYQTDMNQKISIIMTGINSDSKSIMKTEIIDDSLMQVDDEYLTFLKKNDNGTYKILSGPQGRLKLENDELSSMQFVSERVKTNDPGMNIQVKKANVNDVTEEIRGYLANK